MSRATRINTFLRNRYNRKQRARLCNTEFSLIASNCNGACILNDLGLPFNSPFVNLWIKPADFVRMCTDFKNYMEKPLIFIEDSQYDYPVGCIGDVTIYFEHYQSEEDAKTAWERRKDRIHYDNLYFLMTDRDGCTREDMMRFDALPYRNKVIFTHVSENTVGSGVYIPGFENEDSVGHCMFYKNPYTHKKYYDAFDFVKWFNEG